MSADGVNYALLPMSSVEVAVIGRGLIGAAAARHLAEGGISVALIGPGEPEDRTTSQGPFNSHADEGRITRIAARQAVWATLGANSIKRYHDIETRSGIGFHHQAGLVVSGSDIGPWLDSGLINGSDIRRVGADEVERATSLHVDPSHETAYEGPPAGYVNPRRLVAAQTKLVEAAGGVVVDDAVTVLGWTSGGHEVRGAFGSIQADRVLLATGAFGHNLMERQLDVERRPRTILLSEFAEAPNVPSLIHEDPPDDRLEGLYWVPPVRFPDGRTYLKIGGSLRSSPLMESGEMVEWFHSDGDVTEIAALDASLRALLPGTVIRHQTSTPCVITGTTTGYPYVGWVDNGVAVAIGGNGSAAKSSDELGRLAASLFSEDGWDTGYDAELFEPRFR